MVSTNANCVTDTRKTSWKRNAKRTKSKEDYSGTHHNVPAWQASPERVCKCECACVRSLWSSVKTRIHVTFRIWNVNKSSQLQFEIYLDVIYDVRWGSYVSYELEYVKLIAPQSVAKEDCLFGLFWMSK